MTSAPGLRSVQGPQNGPSATWRDRILIVLGALLVFWFTRGYYLGDTTVYIADAARYFGHSPSGAGNLLWEFGHLLWRPTGWLILEIGWPAIHAFTGWQPAVAAGYAFLAINLVSSLLTVLLWYSLALGTGCSRFSAALVAGCIACSSAFLTYTHSGSSYIPGLLCITLAVWLLRRRDRGARAIGASGALTALAALLWFPYVLSVPGVLFLALSPAPEPVLPWTFFSTPSLRTALRLCLVLALCLALGYGAGAWAQHVHSVSDAKAWFASSSHGWSQSNRIVRLATGLPRAFFYMGKDGVLYKRFLRKDPFARVTVGDLVKASLWKILAFGIFLLCLFWELVRPSTRKWTLLMFLVGAFPTLFFAVFLFEPGSPERYFPAYPFLILALAWILRDFPSVRRPAQLYVVGFLLCVALTSVYSVNRFRIGAEDQASLARIAPLKARLRPGSMVAILTNQDDLSEMCNRNPVAPINRPAPLRLYDVVEPATQRVLTWRQEFAHEAMAAWAAGGDVWVSTRLWQPVPRPDWYWVEGDDPRVRWNEIPSFFQPLITDDECGGADGFFRLAKTETVTKALAELSSQYSPTK